MQLDSKLKISKSKNKQNVSEASKPIKKKEKKKVQAKKSKKIINF